MVKSVRYLFSGFGTFILPFYFKLLRVLIILDYCLGPVSDLILDRFFLHISYLIRFWIDFWLFLSGLCMTRFFKRKFWTFFEWRKQYVIKMNVYVFIFIVKNYKNRYINISQWKDFITWIYERILYITTD